MVQQKRSGALITIIVGVLVVGGALAWLFLKGPKAKEATTESALISREGIHWHCQLAIKIDGKDITIPDDTGISDNHSPIHTHEGEPNKIHMEFSSVVRADDLKLGKFFEVWGQPFSSSRLMDKDTSQGGTLAMKVNGQDNVEFENYQMKDGDKIELVYNSAK